MAVTSDKAGPFFYVLQDALRILFVDSDPILREFAVVNLSADNATIETAPDGAAALVAVEAAAPDIVLLDLDVPGAGGLDVVRRLRADPRHRFLPVIVVTGREDLPAVEQAFAAGATSFVVKPLNWRLLTHQIRYVHRAAHNERRLAEGEGAAVERLQELAAEGARFIAHALPQTPALKSAAVAFARVADAALSGVEAAKNGEAEAA
jgi:DNA-binding response OmpR family regulator